MSTPAAPPPNMNDILTAMSVIMRPTPVAPADDKGITKVIIGGIVALVGAVMFGLVFWVGASVSGLSTTVTKMSTNVDQLQTSITSLQQGQGAAATQLSDGKATDARQDARMDAQEADMSRMKERVRILEGQKPLGDLPLPSHRDY